MCPAPRPCYRCSGRRETGYEQSRNTHHDRDRMQGWGPEPGMPPGMQSKHTAPACVSCAEPARRSVSVLNGLSTCLAAPAYERHPARAPQSAGAYLHISCSVHCTHEDLHTVPSYTRRIETGP